jgi:hypothetical protein
VSDKSVLQQLRLAASYASPVVLQRELAALIGVVDAVRNHIEVESVCVVCGGTLAQTMSTDDNPEGLTFRHLYGCPIVLLEEPWDAEPAPLPTTVTLSIPCTPFGANQMIRMGMHKLGREKTQLRRDAELAWRGAGSVTFKRARYDVRVVCGHGNARDEDNYSTGAVKFIIDGLKGYAFADDSPKYLERGSIEIVYEPNIFKTGRIELTLTEIGAN